MYKKLFITLLTLLFCGISYAQERLDRWVWPDEHIEDAIFVQLGIGPKIGAGFDMASNPSFFDFNFNGGFTYQFGAAINFHIAHHPSLGMRGSDRVGLEIEASYGQRNFKADNKILSMKCIEIPVLLQFYLTREWLLEAGVTPVKGLGVSPDNLQIADVVANVGSIKGDDMMISAGATYKTDFGLMVGLRYNLGTSKWAENIHSKTHTAMVSVTYLLSVLK